MGVLTVRPGSAITVCAPPMHWSQMYTCGPAINFLTCFWLFPQNEHNRRLPESGTRPLYLGSRARSVYANAQTPGVWHTRGSVHYGKEVVMSSIRSSVPPPGVPA